jgi:acyl transferase domain-containing protein/NAD(P)H-dependent flavin oxidoreductase YrpB (nitropropane dioxygenase family)
MLSPFLVLTPSHHCDARLAIASACAGETGILDLGHAEDWRAQKPVVHALSGQVRANGFWGIRWDARGDASRAPQLLKELLGGDRCPVLILAGIEGSDALRAAVVQVRQIASRVLLEVYSLKDARAGQEAGFDGLVVKGNEAGGRVSTESTFVLLQSLRRGITIPYWVQGGIGPDTAAAAFLAGAAGVVLCEQLWLAAESPFGADERRLWGQLDGSETICLHEKGDYHRFFNRAAPRIPLGQEIAFARILAEKHHDVAGILAAFRQRVKENRETARAARALAPEGPLARAHGTRYPILQGPMTRVSDTVAFCDAVSSNGGLPFHALSLMTGPEVRALLTATRERMGDRAWGVGILGFAPAELRQAQFEAIRATRPPLALIAGGRPSQARKLEEDGIPTYLHVPSPGLLESFIADGARKFIFEGRECGGHVGPRSSFCLWQSAIDVLLRAEVQRPEEFHIIFAGGIHDGLSAAMVATLAAPLTARRMKIGVLMGTAYLFTHEAVQSGAISAEYQRQALGCRETVLLEAGIGHATRCINTPFAEEFERVRQELHRAGKSSDDVRMELEKLNIGRLRIASKGIARSSDPRGSGGKAALVAVSEEEQHRQGMYMIGQVAGLRNEVISMADLHADVSQGQLAFLNEQPERPQMANGQGQPAGLKSKEIAIVGMACMFPQAKDVRRYWENICRRVDAVREVPAERWRLEDFYSEDRQARDRVYSKWGGFLDKVFFDPVKWRIPPATLQHIEPIQLLALEVASQAMTDAGYDKRPCDRERAGVLFAVPSSHDVGMAYSFRTMLRHYMPKVEGLSPEQREAICANLEKQLPEWTEDSFPGFLGNVVAGRIARELDLHGPNFTVDAACAASLAALYTAVEQLRTGTSDLMLVGGADGTNNPFCYMSFAKTHALSPRGKSRSFDDSGDGIALGEGIACLVLKRLEDAERDGDQIYAVIKGIGASSDGKNRSLTAPYPPGQCRAVTRAYEDAGVSPASVALIEAHGTGTAAGDSAELTTLTQVFSPHNVKPQSVAVGSVKSMIGHTKTVAGLASVIKAALALKHQVLPATINIEKPSTRIDWSSSPFYLNTETRPWLPSAEGHPRRAGVSSFGFGGTNFHVVLEEHIGSTSSSTGQNWTPRSAEVIVLHRASRDEMRSALAKLDEQLAGTATADLAGLAAAVLYEESNRAGAGRTCRLAIIAESIEDLHQKLGKASARLTGHSELHDPAGIYYSETTPAKPSELCFLYPGQGSQAVNMLRDLVAASPWCDELFREADRLTAESLAQPLSRYVYPPPVFSDEERQQLAAELNDTRVAQPALGIVELFATELLERFGVHPARVAGHSYGELPALHAAGCLSRADLLRLSAARGRVCAEVGASCPGAMAAVGASAETTLTALKELNIPAHLANRNGPDQTVIGGSAEAIEAAVGQLAKRGLRARVLKVSAAFHTPLLAAASKGMEPHLNAASFQTPRLPVYSNTTAAPHAGDPAALRGLLARHLREPVLFEKQIRRLHADGARVFLEVGPGQVLTNLVSRILGGESIMALPLDAPGRDGWTQLAHVLGRLSVLGLPVNLNAWFAGRDFAPRTVEQYLDQARAENSPRSTDWILSPNKAEPVTPLPGPARTVEQTKPVAPPPAPKKAAEGERPIQPSTRSVCTQEKARTAMLTNNGYHHTNGNTNHHTADSTLVDGSTATRLLLETQQTISRLIERYLETQERILLHAAPSVAPPATMAPPVSLEAEPVPEVAPSAPVVRSSRLRAMPERAPAPTVEKGRLTPSNRLMAATAPTRPERATPPVTPSVSKTNGHAPAAASKPATAPAPQPTEPAGADAAPSTEQFRQDLLQVVSARTGYPTDALDETLHLESALGIDSIKTVEIFSKLKPYHVYFRAEGQEEEELLAEFTKMKTLRDIINSYDRRRQAHIAKDEGSAASGSVKRYEVVPVAAAATMNGSKKNYLTASSSS